MLSLLTISWSCRFGRKDCLLVKALRKMKKSGAHPEIQNASASLRKQRFGDAELSALSGQSCGTAQSHVALLGELD